MQLRTFKTTLFLLIPFLAMTEGGAMYQPLANVPLWIGDMTLMKQFSGIGSYFLYFIIILSTAFYFIPFLRSYAGNPDAQITSAAVEQLKTWATFSMIRQVLGFVVIAIYAYLLAMVNKEKVK